VGLREEHHGAGTAKGGEHDGFAPAQGIGQMAAEQGGDQVAHAIRPNGEAGIGERVAGAGEVQGQEGHDKTAELVQEQAEKEDPRGRRQGAEGGRQREFSGGRRRGLLGFSDGVHIGK